jgi:hypothetical protein
MTGRKRDNLPIGGLREITWEIGTAELQRSVMAEETILMMHGKGITNAEKIRSIIRQRRNLMVVLTATGRPNASPSNKFVNEHAWVLSLAVTGDLIVLTDPDKKEYALRSDALEKLPKFLDDLRRAEPIVWRPS